MTPAFASSSLYFPIASSSFGSGMASDSDNLLALTIAMKRIVDSSFSLRSRPPLLPAGFSALLRRRTRSGQIDTRIDHFGDRVRKRDESSGPSARSKRNRSQKQWKNRDLGLV